MLPNCYSIDAFQNAYSCQIFPCSDKSAWQNVGGPEVKPPKYEKKAGRPPKARKKSAHEVQGRIGPRLSKHGVTMHCSHCGNSDHNVATCELKKAGEPAVKKRKRSTIENEDEEARHEEEMHEAQYTQVWATKQTLIYLVQNAYIDKWLQMPCFRRTQNKLELKHCCLKWTTPWYLNY